MFKKLIVVLLCISFVGFALAFIGAGKKDKGAAEGVTEEVTIKWLTFDSPHSSGSVTKMLDQMYAETGVKLIVETAPHEYIYEKQTLAATGHSGEWDIYMIDNAWAPEFSRAGWLVDLTPYVNKNKDEIDPDDIFESFYNAFSWENKQYGLPFYADSQNFSYRADILEDPKERAAFKKKYGYDYMPLIEEGKLDQVKAYTELAPFFTRENYKDPTLGEVHEKFYGTSFVRARDLSSMCDYLEILYSLGGDIIYGQPEYALPIPAGKKYYPALDTDIAIEAAKQFQYISSPEAGIAPPGLAMHSFFELLSLFEQGKIAFVTAWSICGHDFRDPNTTRPELTDKIKMAPGLIYKGYFNKNVQPGGGRSGRVGGWGLGVSVDTKYPDEAWSVLKFLCGKEHAKEITIAGTEHPRYSVYGDPELQEMFPFFAATLVTMPTHRPVPLFPEYKKIEEIVVEQLNGMAGGTVDVEAGLALAQKELYELMEVSGYIK